MRGRIIARLTAGAVALLPAPILAGDFPDPSIIKVGGDHVAVATGGNYAPIMRVLRSSDGMRTWRIDSAVFSRAPRWAKTDFWAPEITRLGSGVYAVFYSALPRPGALPKAKRKSWLCLGVATAPTPSGPWRDAGRPLRCTKLGSIDPFAVRDERGALYLIYKQDGNEFKKPTPLFAQRLREDGKRLLGRPRELFRNSRRFEKRVVEAPHVIRRGGFFYMTYSANRCCTRKCAYSVGVARATRLLGPWRKFDGNPILRTGRGWRCPGHVSIVDEGAAGLTAVFHAYRSGEARIAGRQLLAAPLLFAADGWPRIGDTYPPAPSPGALRSDFTDTFPAPRLALDWEWPLRRVPGIRTANGLTLTAARANRRRLDGGVVVRRTATERYTATTVVDFASLSGRSRAGIASYRSGFEAIGISAGVTDALIWRRRKGKYKELAAVPVPPTGLVHLRMIARGNTFRFQISADGTTFRPAGPSLRGPIEESARLGLVVGGTRGARARFLSATLDED